MSKPKATRLHYVKDSSAPRRVEGDFMRTLIDTVTLDVWRAIMTATVEAAKSGDATARGFLASYLIGKPGFDSPRPAVVVVNALAGRSDVAERLAHHHRVSALDFEHDTAEAVADELRRLDATSHPGDG